jgi:hypothetical protein
MNSLLSDFIKVASNLSPRVVESMVIEVRLWAPNFGVKARVSMFPVIMKDASWI